METIVSDLHGQTEYARNPSEYINALSPELKRGFQARVQAQLQHNLNQAKELIAYSAQKQNIVLLIEKVSRICYVYYKGVQSFTCPIELGPKWHENSTLTKGATPEGIFHTTRKTDTRQGHYYKQVFLNIALPINREPISLHGGGIQNKNWTNGSIAFINNDIDRLFDYLKLGTLIMISPGFGEEALV